MAQQKDQRSGGSKKSKKPKTGAKKAKKAIARAEKSVAAARSAVRALNKKLRKRVSTLSKQTARLSAEQGRERKKLDAAQTAARKAETPPAAEAASAGSDGPAFAPTASPPSPSAADDQDGHADTVLTPPLPAPQPAAGTMIELRERARERKIPGYSRMSKASLIAALDPQES